MSTLSLLKLSSLRFHDIHVHIQFNNFLKSLVLTVFKALILIGTIFELTFYQFMKYLIRSLDYNTVQI